MPIATVQLSAQDNLIVMTIMNFGQTIVDAQKFVIGMISIPNSMSSRVMTVTATEIHHVMMIEYIPRAATEVRTARAVVIRHITYEMPRTKNQGLHTPKDLSLSRKSRGLTYDSLLVIFL